MTRIALIKYELGDFKKFNELLLEVVEIDEEIYDDGNWLKAVRLSNLGLSCYLLQDYRNAQKHYESALRIINGVNLDTEDFLVIKSKVYNNYGMNFDVLAQYESAKEQYKIAIGIIETLNKNSNGAYAEEYGLYATNIASVCLSTRDFEVALRCLKIGLNETEKKYKETESNRLIPVIASLENLLGRVYAEKKDNVSAENHYRRAISWYVAKNGKFAELYRAEIALIRNNLGALYITAKRYNDAVEELTSAYKIFTELSCTEKTYRRMRALSAFNLASVFVAKLNPKNALPYILESYETYSTLVAEGLTFCADMQKKSLTLLASVYFLTFHPIKAIKLLVGSGAK